MAEPTMREMLEAGVHFGHQTNRWNPKMSKYIFGKRNGIHIIDLQKTVPLFSSAYKFLVGVASRGGKILFVGTKKQAQEIIAEQAVGAEQFFVNNRWLGGTLTNYRTIKASIDRLRSIEKMELDGTFEKLAKKEVLQLTRERIKLEKNLGGIKDMTKLPEAVFIIDTKKEHIAVAESRKLGIPIVAMLDTNCNPDEIDHPIPGNDDAIRAIRIIVSKVAEAAIEGNAIYQKTLVSKEGDDSQAQATGQGMPHISEREMAGGPKVEVVRAQIAHNPAVAATGAAAPVSPETGAITPTEATTVAAKISAAPAQEK